MEKIKILWVGDAVTPTGFSRVNHSILKYLPEDLFEVYVLGVNYWGDPHEYPYRIWPAGIGKVGDVWGISRIKYFNEVGFDLIFILNDIWIVAKYLEEIKKHFKKLPHIVTYSPIDSDYQNPEWFKDFDIVSKVCTYSEYGKRVLEESYEGDVTIVPHGNDTSVFYPLEGTKQELRAKLFPKFPEVYDSFIVLNANRNQPRKRLDVAVEGFSLFSEDKDDVRYYHHAGIQDAGLDIIRLTKIFNVHEKLVVTNLEHGVQKVPDNVLNLIYNVSDVGINTSMGEGWGLTNTEHASVGKPQVVPDHSACTELFYDCGQLIPTYGNFVFEKTMTLGRVCRAEDFAEKLNELYYSQELYDSLAKKGLIKFTSKEYSWEEISKTWQYLFMGLLNG